MKYVLITGASQGIGEFFAREYAKRRRNLILVARSKDKLTTLAKELSAEHGIQAEVIAQDLSQLDSAEKLFEACKSKEVETLINNAGFGMSDDFSSQPLVEIERMLMVNMVTLTKLTHLFLPQLKSTRGNVINVASSAAFQPVPYMAAYAATKAYVLHLSEGLHVELEGTGVTVLALCPGATETGFFDVAKIALHETYFPTETPQKVVLTALKALEAKKSFVVSGWKNKVAAFSGRLVPRSLTVKIAKQLMGH